MPRHSARGRRFPGAEGGVKQDFFINNIIYLDFVANGS